MHKAYEGLVFLFKKKIYNNSEQQLEDQDDLKEKLFFHDLINQTHGLLLFINQKQAIGHGVLPNEVHLIEKEIKTIQSLVRDHYNLKHKDLIKTFDWVPFSYAKLAFTSLSNNYLSEMEVNVTFTIHGELVEEDLIYYPCFYRILNNLIKNISESNCEKAEFNFLLNEKGIYIETKNSLKKSSADSSEGIARVILEDRKNAIKSLGLDSIHHQAQENFGTFSFEIENNQWINKVYLPTKSCITHIKTHKIAA